MSETILATKLYIPPTRSNVVLRPRLIEQLNQGLHRKLTLISAPAGFGKTTLLSKWVTNRKRPVAWLSLDKGDSDPTRFLTYLVAALQTVMPNIGQGVLSALQAPQPPPIEPVLTNLLNESTTIPEDFILVLDDYYVVDAKTIDHALNFLLEHLPPQMHLVIATREDPQLFLARLRVQDQLTELRATDLRFAPSEAAEFLSNVMGLNLSTEDIVALENRTEGWIAGLQLAAISMQGNPNATNFIQSFTGSHRFVMDYLVEQVLQQQSESVQTFLLRTSLLDRLCGPLCDAVLQTSSSYGQETLEYLERANLFIVPLDNERHWYRYHHLFADLLRQRLYQNIASSTGNVESSMNALHIRASQWYEDNGLEIEAFQHAAAANDIERAERLIEDKGIQRHFRGAVTPILDWLGSLPKTVKDARPSLWWRHASLLLVVGQATGVEEKLNAAEAGLRGIEADDKTRVLIGRIATARATLALTRYDAQTMLAQSRRALEYLSPNNVVTRANAYWTLGMGYFFHGDRVAARQSLEQAISLGQTSGDIFTIILATIGLGITQEAENQLFLAAETYRRVLQLTNDQPLQIINEVHLGLARILYEWNNLDAAEQHGQQSLDLARQYDRVVDRFINSEVFLARVKLARGDVDGASAILAEADQSARRQNFVHRIPEVAAAQVLVLLRQGNVAAAAQLAQTHQLTISQARLHLAQDNPSAALILLERLRQEMEEKDWKDERLKVLVLQAVALHMHHDKDKAFQALSEALALAESGGCIRLFIDEGEPMRFLISDFRLKIEKHVHNKNDEKSRRLLDYSSKLLGAFKTPIARTVKAQTLAPHPFGSAGVTNHKSQRDASQSEIPIEPLSQRELEILQLIAQGLSNDEIGERLYLALSTVKGHNRNIFEKLQVKSRTEALARARELGLL